MYLDSFDLKILDIVQSDCRIPTETIAELVGLSASAVQRRLKKLRAEKVIRAEVAILNTQLLPPSLSFIAGIEIERDNYSALTQFKLWAADKKNIQQIYYVTGEVDLIVLITAATTAQYDALIEELMASNPLIRRVNTNVVLDAPKKSFYQPID
jgi:Lrp/AsnC family transcriptional regulator, leucine-responsive regulatory protein